MSTATILASGAGATCGAALIPLGVWPVAAVINRRRDARDSAAVQAFTQKVTAGLCAQIADGNAAELAVTIDSVNPEPVKLALAAHCHITAIDVRLLAANNLDAAAHTAAALHRLDALTGTRRLAEFFDRYTACATPLANAVAARLLLARLAEYYPHGTDERGLVDVAIARLAAATDDLPNGRVLNLTRLGEFDPAPMHAAHAAWRKAAHDAGIIDIPGVVQFRGDVMVPVTAQTAPVYPHGHRLAHTNGMDTDAALAGNGGAA